MKVDIKEQIEPYSESSSWITFDSMRMAADVLGCSARHLGQQLAGQREYTKTKIGKVTQIREHNEQANSTPSTVRVDTDRPQENPALGSLAFSGGWGWYKQAMVQAAAAVEWFRGKLHKP